MIHKRILFLCCVLLPFVAGAQYTINGQVTDGSKGEKIAGAVVYLTDLKTGTVTDTAGQFEISNLPEGNFVCQVSFIGYNTQVKKVNVPADTPIVFSLQVSHKEIEEIVVTGTSKSTALKESTVPTVVVNKEALFHSSATNIVDAITKTPGIAQISTGGGVSKPVVRGLSYNRVLTLNNGTRQEGQQWGDEHGIEIDEYSVDRVEIIKGPGSLIYGSDAMGGVINFMRPQPLPAGKIETNLLTEYQSNNHLLGWSLYNAGTQGKLSWQARVSNRYAGAFKSKYDGYVANTGFNEWSGNGLLSMQHKYGYVQLVVSSFNTQLGFNEGERDSLGNWLNDDSESISRKAWGNYNIHLPFQRVNHQLMQVRNLVYLPHRSSLEFNLGYQNNMRREFEENPKQPGLFLMLHTFNYDVKYHLPDFKHWETTLGLNGMVQLNKNLGNEYLIPDYIQGDAGIFAVTKRSWDKVSFSAGVRADLRSLTTKALWLDSSGNFTDDALAGIIVVYERYRKVFGSATGNIGISIFPVPLLTIKLNAGSGFRTPTVSELASNGVHEGTLRYEQGNGNLQPEYSWQGDAGIAFNNAHIRFEAAAFVNYVQRFTYAVKVPGSNGGDSLPDPSQPIVLFSFKQHDALLFGAEAVLDIHPHPIDWLHIENTMSYVRGIQPGAQAGLTNLPFMPPLRWISGLRAEIDKLGRVLEHAYVGIESDFHAEQNFVLTYANTETTTPRYWLLNASIGTDIQVRGKKRLTVQIAANNLLDVGYQDHLSRWKYNGENPQTGRTGIYNMGRNFVVKCMVPLYNK